MLSLRVLRRLVGQCHSLNAETFLLTRVVLVGGVSPTSLSSVFYAPCSRVAVTALSPAPIRATRKLEAGSSFKERSAVVDSLSLTPGVARPTPFDKVVTTVP